MSFPFNRARQNALLAFFDTNPTETPFSYLTYKQHHPNECVTACFRLISDRSTAEAPSDGLSFSESLLTAAHYKLYLHPVVDLNNIPENCLLFGMTNEPKNHAHLILIQKGHPTAIYDPATGTVHRGSDLPVLAWTHLAIIYKPGRLENAD